MTVIVFALILFFIVSLVFVIASIATNSEYSDLFFILSLLFSIIFVGMCISLACMEFEPKAIDVYRGKTTLEITYRDNVAIDSVVVFKKNAEK